jgi:hypothetical protein
MLIYMKTVTDTGCKWIVRRDLRGARLFIWSMARIYGHISHKLALFLFMIFPHGAERERLPGVGI